MDEIKALQTRGVPFNFWIGSLIRTILMIKEHESMTLQSELSICLAKLKMIEDGLQKEAEHANCANDAKSFRDARLLVIDVRKDVQKRLEELSKDVS